MSVEQVARAHYDRRKALADLVSRLVARLWGTVDPADLDASWLTILPQLMLGISGAQLTAARLAEPYVAAALLEQGVSRGADGTLVAEAFAGVASDGRGLHGLLVNPITVVKSGIAGGATVAQSMAAGLANLDLIARTQVADAGRAADGVALTSRRAATGYVRMTVGKTCARCVVLAGRNYGWNAGFDRHPRCDCIHVPAAEDRADDIRTDPRAYFDSLSRAEQDKAFTKVGAEAIRDGADIAQVVNARRGMQTAAVFGRDVLVTTEGATRPGVAGRRLGAGRGGRAARLMPEEIYREANGDRDEAIRLLKLHGYIT